MSRKIRNRRRGMMAIENAIIMSVFFLIVFAIVVGGTGIFRAQQVACLAHEASRYAAVRGKGLVNAPGNSSATSQQIYDNAVEPRIVGLYPNQLAVAVWWIDGITGTAYDWDSSSRVVASLDSNNKSVSNRVRVTVTYQWFPEFYLVGPLNLQTTSEMPLF